uniref:Fatty acid hydroxylase domain-containing protein n=1 Tax=viral metagenome TaxID=1070528 RepID=A0A6C0EWH1_9ZZZZ
MDFLLDKANYIIETSFKDLYKFLNIFFRPNLSENIKVINNLKENAPSWLLILVTISIISYPNILLGVITFFVFLFIAYFYHVLTHVNKNIFSIVHHYHHEHDNLFSHFIQIILELSIPYPFVMLSYFFGINILDPWIIVYFMLFYCSVHNINYSIFKVNGVHRLHHTEVNLNFGPDICDVMFGTKHSSEDCVENTNHYIPNIIIITGIVLILKYVCRTEWVKDSLLVSLITLLSSGIILLFVSSIILWYLESEKYNNKIENRLCGEGCVVKDTLSKSYKKDKPAEPNNLDKPVQI